RYILRRLPAGESRLLVRATNFPALSITVQLDPGDVRLRPIVMDSSAAGRAAQELPGVAINAPAAIDYRLAGFERRRKIGRGQYLTEADVARTGAYNLADALKGMRGVTYECGGGGGCYVRMARAPMRCLPEYIIDDHVNNDFGPLTPIHEDRKS